MAMIDPVKVEVVIKSMSPGILNKKEDGTFDYQIINEWQLCPKCNGEGKKPQIQMTSLGPFNVEAACDLCNGKKIISRITGEPPK